MLKMLERDERAPSHLESSYILQRKGMAWLGLAFPVAFLLSSILGRTEFQTSISAYYWTLGLERDFFVGALFAIGAFLYLYKGDSLAENLILDVAGGLAVLVAFVPTTQPSDGATGAPGFSWHGLFAAAFFICIAFYCYSMTFLTNPQDPRASVRRERFKVHYVVCTIAIIGAVAAAVILHFLGGPIFWPEAIAVWAFSAFWYLNTRELDPSEPWIPFLWRQKPEVIAAA